MRFLILLAFPVLAGCTQLFLQPDREQVLHPEELGLAYEDVFLPDENGDRIHGWYLPAHGQARGTILHLHGNAENISTFISQVWWLPPHGFNVFMLDYGGYGRSEGVATVRNVHEDARLALDWLLARPGADSGRLAVYGQSLGGSVALFTVAHHPQRSRVRAVIAEGAFSGYSRIAREKMNRLWLTWAFQWPLSFLFSDEFSAEDAIGRLEGVPVLLIHGGADEVVEPRHARILFDAAGEPRELWTIEDGGHIDAMASSGFRDRLLKYLELVTGPLVVDAVRD